MAIDEDWEHYDYGWVTKYKDPYGDITHSWDAYWLQDDGDWNDDAYAFDDFCELVPGTEAYDSNWHWESGLIEQDWDHSYVDTTGVSLDEYGPTGDTGSGSVTVSIGVSGVTFSYTYDQSMKVSNESSLKENYGRWDLDSGLYANDTTSVTEPGTSCWIDDPGSGAGSIDMIYLTSDATWMYPHNNSPAYKTTSASGVIETKYY